VFSPDNAGHAEFLPVLNFVTTGDGRLIYGGSSYKKELQKLDRYRRLIVALRKGGRAIAINDEAVDNIERVVKEKVRGTDCDDPHIIALLAAANCALLCSSDKRSFPFVQDRTYYSKGNCRVKIYTSSRNRDLLVKQKSRIWNIE
jgi:hypothetical protein